ncbi:unnamed protein product, partial [Mesorhabditis spiculigera]
MIFKALIFAFCVSSAVDVFNATDNPIRGATIKLYDKDTLGKDDNLGQTKSDAQGYFQTSGHAREITNIDPKYNIYHDCNDGVKPCQRKFHINIPNRYINKGKEPSKVFDAGTIELAGKYPGESRDCLH